MKSGNGRYKFHEEIGNIVTEVPGIIKDPACGGKHNIPLFCSVIKSNKTEFCNVDILILQNNKIKILMEIDESDTKPTQICGKFLTSALSKYYIHGPKSNKVEVEMDSSVLFVQIVSAKKLKPESKKGGQWENIEKEIRDILPLKNIEKYRLIFDKDNDSDKLRTEILSTIKSFLT